MSRSALLTMWAVKLARQSLRQPASSAACLSSTLGRDWNGGESRPPLLSSLLGIGSIGGVLVGGYLWDTSVLCEDEKKAAAGQTKVRGISCGHPFH